MALVLHLVSAYDSISPVLDHYFKAFIEGVRSLLKVSSSNQEKAASRSLNTLEVVREVHLH